MLLGASRGVYTAIERMGKSKGGKGGRIVNVASVAGLTVSTLRKCLKRLKHESSLGIATIARLLRQDGSALLCSNSLFIHDFSKNQSHNSICL